MRRRRFHPPTWTAAIETVLHSILCLAGRTPPITDEQDRILTDVYLRCDDLRTRRRRPAEKTNRELAAKYQISPRTVTNWRREGCPFERGQARVLGWVARRRYAPAGAKAKFAKQLRKRQSWATCAFFRNLIAGMRTDALAHNAIRRARGEPVPADDRRYRQRAPFSGEWWQSGPFTLLPMTDAERRALNIPQMPVDTGTAGG